jgi:hypothetical protein
MAARGYCWTHTLSIANSAAAPVPVGVKYTCMDGRKTRRIHTALVPGAPLAAAHITAASLPAHACVWHCHQVRQGTHSSAGIIVALQASVYAAACQGTHGVDAGEGRLRQEDLLVGRRRAERERHAGARLESAAAVAGDLDGQACGIDWRDEEGPNVQHLRRHIMVLATGDN